MQQSLDAMKTALLVLTALNERRQPDPADIEALQQYGPQRDGMELDEFACEVIQQALRHRAAIRDQGAKSGSA